MSVMDNEWVGTQAIWGRNPQALYYGFSAAVAIVFLLLLLLLFVAMPLSKVLETPRHSRTQETETSLRQEQHLIPPNIPLLGTIEVCWMGKSRNHEPWVLISVSH